MSDFFLPQSSNRPRQSGFSLLEIMIVILIMGIGAGAIRLAVASNDPLDETVEVAEAFDYWFDRVLDQALLSQSDIGLYFLKDGLIQLSWRAGQESGNEPDIVWEEQERIEYTNGSKRDLLRVELTLGIESPLWIDLEANEPDIEPSLTPHVIIFASEEYTPSFKLEMHNEQYADEYMTLVGDGFNRLALSRETR